MVATLRQCVVECVARVDLVRKDGRDNDKSNFAPMWSDCLMLAHAGSPLLGWKDIVCGLWSVSNISRESSGRESSFLFGSRKKEREKKIKRLEWNCRIACFVFHHGVVADPAIYFHGMTLANR